MEGVPELLVSAGKLVRDESKPITVQRYSDNLLLAPLKAHRPPRREGPMRFQLQRLRSADDASAAMAAIIEAFGAGEITPREAAGLAALVEVYVKVKQAAVTKKPVPVILQWNWH